MRSVGRSILTAIALLAIIGTTAACGTEDCCADPGAPRAARPAVSPAPGDHTLAIDWAGKERTWALHAPAGYRPGAPTPLVVALHGTDQSPEGLRDISGLDALADTEGFLVAYPKALDKQFSRATEQGDDINFVRALVDKMVKEWSVDPARVYATGFSSGGELTYALGVEAPEVFAAIAPVSGAFAAGPAASDPNYKPGRPVGLITFIGREDRNSTRMYSGLSRWQKNLNCTVGTPAWVDGGRTVNRTSSTCPDGSQVVDYTVNGMGHAWPSASGFPAAVDATTAMWEFFAATSRR
ncbi:PHB depolymerase family esterase [Micromonospora sp. WMMD1102]|uniref:extracellular catalytic domain type 1 short-chain-length polyhydroxyalkanoate depolymerase n=1 Tax=Micromonospora sp. WMMD1102 TaxID=3016105 RepID=UPI0024152F16|nr:PHB depolymerase family esterase [Micromonospora sp. WMMD1102]MDG4790852.1 PHB depolymerase family esterase [Micromonospora sp. WMMD1102]